MMTKQNLLIAFLLMSCTYSFSQSLNQKTYCNPLNINYGLGKTHRHSADPVVVLFKDKYFLFTTGDIRGYRVSVDLFNWEDIVLPDSEWAKLSYHSEMVAPALFADDNYIYFLNFNNGSKEPYPVCRSSDPEKGKWEKCGEIAREVKDPAFFADNGKLYLYFGLGGIMEFMELDPNTFHEIPGKYSVTRPIEPDVESFESGYFLGRREMMHQVDAAEWLGKFKNMPCPEASWMTKYNNKYYLQLATPGTLSQWYCDIVMEGDTPAGPFREMEYNPVSLKAGGFIGSAGHSCVFQDKQKNWWRITTMWLGVRHGFERRLGLFPVSFDKKRRMITHTLLGDYPLNKSGNPATGFSGNFAGWWNLSINKPCQVSSEYDTISLAKNATDENIRTWWSAKTSKPGEWLYIDLQKKCKVNALQVNFYEDRFDPSLNGSTDYQAYKIFISDDGKKWNLLIDKSQNKTCIPNDYIELDQPVLTRFLKIENVHTAKNSLFAISDFRVFGNGQGVPPAETQIKSIKRIEADKRFGFLEWKEVDNADGYVIHFGTDPTFLNQSIQITGNKKTNLTTHILNRNINYYFQVDSYNRNGITRGKTVKEMNP